jgi:hypothetical protein
MRSKPPKRWVRRHRRSIVGCAAGAAAVSIEALCALSGCYTHQCDPSLSDFGGGRMLDENTYETNGVDEPWLDYPGNVTLTVHYPDVGRVPTSIDPYVGISRYPNGPDSNWTEAAGALAEYSSLSRTSFQVSNKTCASYFARFVVHFPPISRADAGPDRPQDSPSD